MPRIAVSRALALKSPKGGLVEYEAGYAGPVPAWVADMLVTAGAATRLPDPDVAATRLPDPDASAKSLADGGDLPRGWPAPALRKGR
jgi:hypothetical protein